MLLGGMQRNPFRFKITPLSNGAGDLFFPLSLAPAALWDYVRSDGGDIRVSTNGVALTPRQLVGFDSGAQTGGVFFKASGAVSDYYITCGNRQWVEPANTTATWESAAAAVLHLEDLVDATANANDGSSTSAPATVAGKLGQCKRFTAGSAHHVKLADSTSLSITGDLTLMFWANVASRANWQDMIMKTSAGNVAAPFAFYFAITSGLPALQRGDGTTSGGSTGTAAPSTGAWQHVAVTMAGTTVRHYLQGILNGQGTLSQTATDGGTDLYVGMRSDGFGAFGGDLDELRIYSRALSGGEIAAHFANQNDPAAFWTVGALAQC